jgi:hypothetical protein
VSQNVGQDFAEESRIFDGQNADGIAHGHEIKVGGYVFCFE